MIVIASRSSTTARVSRKVRSAEGRWEPMMASTARANAMSVAVGMAQPVMSPDPPRFTAAYSRAGRRTPPTAAATGTAARAAVPVAAAVGGGLLPALLYAAVNLGGSGDITGWAIPTATDIAFALAVLAIIGSHLPSALRTFLLTLAVVDDLLAITIIATFYTHDLQVAPLLLALVPLTLFTIAVQRHIRSWWLLLPLAATTWALVHASGVHATVAGILLGFAVPVIRRSSGEGPGLAEHFEHRWRPLSASVAVPVFAFFAAGVTVGGANGLSSALRDPVAIGILVGLVVGKPVGVLGLAMLAGVGFTVSLLIGELAF